LVRPLDARYARGSPFSYSCHACSRCCHDKIIHVNPYEVARLARNRGLSTTAFLDRYTDAHGTTLKQTDQGACIFLNPQGCGVHPDRPLVCRLYPLGRRITAAGEEWFGELAPHAQTEGEYGTNGTVDEFLTRQGTAPFIEAVDRYVDLAGKMAHLLAQHTSIDKDLHVDVNRMLEGYQEAPGHDVPAMLDMDQVLQGYCSERGMAVPEDINDKMLLHIEAIQEQLHRSVSLTKEECHER
jgi:Fe-S-cluster containining protein